MSLPRGTALHMRVVTGHTLCVCTGKDPGGVGSWFPCVHPAPPPPVRSAPCRAMNRSVCRPLLCPLHPPSKLPNLRWCWDPDTVRNQSLTPKRLYCHLLKERPTTFPKSQVATVGPGPSTPCSSAGRAATRTSPWAWRPAHGPVHSLAGWGGGRADRHCGSGLAASW